jgi:hypothetical protein
VAEHQHARARPCGRAQRVEVDLVALAPAHQLVGDLHAPALRDRLEKRRVDRRLHDGTVARLRQVPERDVEALHHVGQHLDAARIDAPAEALLHAPRERAGQRGRRGIDRVAEVRVLAQLVEVVLQRLGDREVHVGDPRRQHVVGIRRPLLAAPRAQPLDR